MADVVAIADSMGGHQIDLVGHDWGGAVAWQVAGRFPDRLRSLAVLSTPHPAAFTTSIGEGGEQAERSSYMLFFRQDGSEDLMLADNATGLRNLYGASGSDTGGGRGLRGRLLEPGA